MDIDKKWHEINESWLKSGLPQKRFCEQNNVSYSKFMMVRSALARASLSSNIQAELPQEKKPPSQNAFIPLKMNNQKQPTDHSLPVIEIQLPYGVTLRISADEKFVAP